MKIVLLTALGVLLGLVLFLVVGFLLIKWKLKKLFGGLGDAFKGLSAGMSTLPQYRMKLTDAPGKPLYHPEPMAELTNELAALGFQEAGTYSAGEDSPILIRGMVHEADRILAAIYDLPDQGPMMDLVRDTESGTHLMATSTTTQNLDRARWCRAEIYPGGGVEVLLSVLKQMDTQGPFQKVAVSAFKDVFEQAYAREMDWRVDRGGFTDDEVQRMAGAAATATGDEASGMNEQTLGLIRGAMHGALCGSLEQELREAFLDQTEMSAAQWDRVEDRIEMVHNLSDAATLTGLLGQLDQEPVVVDDMDDEDCEAEEDNRYEALNRRVEEELAFGKPAEVFAKLAAQQPLYGEMKKLAHMDRPSTCDVYLMPEQPDHD